MKIQLTEDQLFELLEVSNMTLSDINEYIDPPFIICQGNRAFFNFHPIKGKANESIERPSRDITGD